MLTTNLVVATQTDSTSNQDASGQQVAAAPNPVVSSNGGVSNVAFYYQGTVPIVGTEPEKLAAHLGDPAIVVTTPPSNSAGTVDAIHAIGAKAYRYIQFYWAPGDENYEGINLNRHPNWAFCGDGKKRSVGRVTSPGRTKWFFIDTNETAVRDQIKRVLAGLKAEGWDGVMFDRGEAATQYAKDLSGDRIWSRQSSCTGSPFRRNATFSDAYVNMLGLAHAAGLEAMMNNGKSPFDPVSPMRPDPRDRDCRNSTYERCRALSDIWSNLNLVLTETASRPKAVLWDRTFSGNKRSERNAAHGQRTVALVTTGTLGGPRNQTRANVFYQWSRIKLFNIAVAVNTGDDRCASAADPDAVCNRYGVYPELVNTTFGRPRRASPVTQNCLKGSDVRCVWVRRYAQGVNVLNVSTKRRPDTVVKLGTPTCRYVYNVFERAPMARNRCVNKVSVKLPPWSGRPLKYSTRPW
jgi:hypothetical protein